MGEQEATLVTHKNFGAYFAIDRELRNLQQSGKYQAAIALCIGNNKGEQFDLDDC